MHSMDSIACMETPKPLGACHAATHSEEVFLETWK